MEDTEIKPKIMNHRILCFVFSKSLSGFHCYIYWQYCCEGVSVTMVTQGATARLRSTCVCPPLAKTTPLASAKCS